MHWLQFGTDFYDCILQYSCQPTFYHPFIGSASLSPLNFFLEKFYYSSFTIHPLSRNNGIPVYVWTASYKYVKWADAVQHENGVLSFCGPIWAWWQLTPVQAEDFQYWSCFLHAHILRMGCRKRAQPAAVAGSCCRGFCRKLGAEHWHLSALL